MASGPYGTLYCGHTDDLASRIWKHKEKAYGGFTRSIMSCGWPGMRATRSANMRFAGNARSRSGTEPERSGSLRS
ncbi:hypothetical protein [Phenylobacterium sp.]|uniref:hypothetical protein n=1 Tax=Phenylobacterium sp. TaxID=1871053 RepID=UPI0032C240C8